MTWVRRSCKLFIKIKKNPLCTGKQTGLQTNNIEKFPATKMSITSPITHPIHRKVQNDPSFGFSPRKINLHWTSRWLKTKYQILNFFLFVVPIQKENKQHVPFPFWFATTEQKYSIWYLDTRWSNEGNKKKINLLWEFIYFHFPSIS